MAALGALVSLIVGVTLASGYSGIARAAVEPGAMPGRWTPVDTMAAEPQASRSDPATRSELLAVTITGTTPSADTAAAGTPLPFAGNEIPITYPRISFAFGMAIYSSALTGVDEAFNKFESAYSAAGYPQPHAAGQNAWPAYLATLTLWLNPVIDVACQVVQSTDQNYELRLLGGVLSGRYAAPDAKNLSFSAGLGGGGYGFSFTRHYGGAVSAPDPSGGYYALDTIDLKGGGAYWTAQGGVTLGLGRQAAVNGLIQYVGAGDVSTDTARAGRVTVNVSGMMFGASLSCFY